MKTIIISAFAISAIFPSISHADSKKAVAALLAEDDILTLQNKMNKGDFSSLELTRAALKQIEKYDKNGPKLNAVLAINPDAEKAARAADIARKSGKNSLMLGIPILVKDNVDTKDNMPTTAGSWALKDNFTNRDNLAVAKLRENGAIILGKTNLSEWANMRGNNSISGWSGVGGQTKNAYDLRRSPCGSSSGTGSAIAANMAVIGIGSETDGSITCPSNMNSLVGIKPTVGLVSRNHVVPISHTQDTLGPMGRNVTDIAIMLNIMAGSDENDKATIDADKNKKDYLAQLSGASLTGKRLGVLQNDIGNQPKTIALFEATIAKLKAAGATIIEIRNSNLEPIGKAEGVVLHYELKADLNAYLATTPANIKTRNLEDLIAFNKANAEKELQFFGQEDFEKAQKTTNLNDPEYIDALHRSHDLAAANLDSIFNSYGVDALIAPTYGPAWMIDEINGDQYSGVSSTELPAVAGYPHLTMPMGFIQGSPVGISFIGRKWEEDKILSLGYAFEKLGRIRRAPKLD